MELRNLSTHPLCSKHIVELGDASLDTDNNQKLVSSSLPVINFDAMVKEYANKLGVQIPSSVDALLCVDGGDEGWLVEFKNGHVGRDARRPLTLKVYDSITVLSELTGKTAEQYRKELVFVLVVNASKNEKVLGKIAAPSDSKSLSDMASKMCSRGDRRFVPFGLNRFVGYCLKEVMVVDEAEFASAIEKVPPSFSMA